MANSGYSSTFTHFDDASFVRRTLAGERAAFDVLVLQYTGMVHALARAGLAHDADSADQLTQEVFLRAWLDLEKLARTETFPAWLAQITRNLAVDWVRHRRRVSGLVQMVPVDDKEALEVPAVELNPHGAAASKEEAVHIMDARIMNILQRYR